MEVNEIIGNAVALGACEQSGKASDWKSLAWLFFSPQGREFCAKNNYPSLDDFQSMDADLGRYGIFVDQSIERENEDAALVGTGRSVLRFSGVDRPYKVILMHGAQVEIRVSNYAVVMIENISGDYEVFNDGTATVL